MLKSIALAQSMSWHCRTRTSRQSDERDGQCTHGEGLFDEQLRRSCPLRQRPSLATYGAQISIRNSGLTNEKSENSVWSRFIMNSLSVGDGRYSSLVNWLSKLVLSRRLFCTSIQRNLSLSRSFPSILRQTTSSAWRISGSFNSNTSNRDTHHYWKQIISRSFDSLYVSVSPKGKSIRLSISHFDQASISGASRNSNRQYCSRF